MIVPKVVECPLLRDNKFTFFLGVASEYNQAEDRVEAFLKLCGNLVPD